MELNFIKSGDYYIPDIQLQNPNIHLGKWGLMRKSYLRIAQPFLFCKSKSRNLKQYIEAILPRPTGKEKNRCGADGFVRAIYIFTQRRF